MSCFKQARDKIRVGDTLPWKQGPRPGCHATGRRWTPFLLPSPKFFSIPSLVHLYTIPYTAVIGARRVPLPQLPLNPWHAPSLLFSDKSPFDPPFAPPRNYVDSRQADLIGSQGARLSPLHARNTQLRFNKRVFGVMDFVRGSRILSTGLV